ncbi:YidC/Oxa1 family membrane protein insertase [Andreprevotia lacus DSM 23236]|jgi:YidC/Oxa1 family membrane protein insertase|uniref:Membrane protein insertase YidC n=1 Tax=Andreprevotia lacus DSM 23236 TaxID=1121001 RepID=A0A1W1XV61_9NEIS|nr:membrane protein insertase YidC [Andreprevotia lacus]SMC27418.1 YidC/Oxa1 family membrane protein insertase [Andreprevotia lacus DSM 23236]
MDTKRLIAFIVLSFGILFLWNSWMDKHYPQPKPGAVASGPAAAGSTAGAAPAAESGALAKGQRVHVTTDFLDAEIDVNGADLRSVKLLKHGAAVDVGVFDQFKALFGGKPVASNDQPFTLLQDSGDHIYVAQTGLLSDVNKDLPMHYTVFTAAKTSYVLDKGQDKLDVRLEATSPEGVKVGKTYTFHRGSYVVDVKYDVANGSAKPLVASAYYKLLRDGKEPVGQHSGIGGTNAYTGPAVYTEESKFKKVAFKELDKGEGSYPHSAGDGWVAMIQHYFASAWIASPVGKPSVCGAKPCEYKVVRQNNGLYAASLTTQLPVVAPGAKYESSVELFVGPQQTRILEAVAPDLDLIKDYGIFKIFAQPLFAVLDFIHTHVVANWGWAIILLTLMIKLAFYPLASTSYRSMAKMRKLAPRMEQLKERHGEDRMKFQQAVMEMYKTEKVNPLGGCLPMLVQIPVFMALYWALIAAVELRQAPWALWIHDLSAKDPYFVLPVLMTITMFVQQSLSPPPPDPMQAKMMKIMPLMFSVLFFFFPAGLVLYYVVNNSLSILQQWYITRQIEKGDKVAANS